MLNVQLNIENYALNIPWKHEIRFTMNTLSGAFATNRHEYSGRLRKNSVRTQEFHWFVHLGQLEHTTQDAQKGRPARPQRAKR